ncbi:recombinase family protein [Euryhalocaulis caribicus]|uniref:recombinase family protein n=1 Tax=Euryhalocaulis caribicus TaxID=1161401 RepID=UPI0003A944A8|nr:recombinase family protein [Euryhalocaulis caribicus]
MTGRRAVRCAIYTRKSSDEGLEQDFNSLDAQREACEAYVASQRHEGWKTLGARYDDGGLSGGTLERPGLQRLLDDVDAGKIDMIVVYKIDRLTRSLGDFARLVEKLDARNCSFVSVTQAFNTSTSMGRLTLNVLLSFAQFEREVTAERIRDKIAASKKKGIWMGGMVPLGYDARERALHVNESEAGTVRTVFDLYLRHGSVRLVKEEADRLGLVSKHHVFESGKTFGGKPLSRGRIHHLLMNPVYAGMIRHNRTNWPGRHKAIIDREKWDRVQAMLSGGAARKRRVGRRNQKPEKVRHGSPLAGTLFDGTGDRLTPSHARSAGSRLRYYVSSRLLRNGAKSDPAGWRLPAAALETLVAREAAAALDRAIAGQRLFASGEDNLDSGLKERATRLASALESDHDRLSSLLDRVTVSRGEIGISIDRGALAETIGIDEAGIVEEALVVSAPFQLRRRGVEARLVSGETEPEPDPVMLRMIARARLWRERILAGDSFDHIAEEEGVTSGFIRTRMLLGFLSPDITKAVLEGRQPVETTLERLVRTELPLDWREQERALGFTR